MSGRRLTPRPYGTSSATPTHSPLFPTRSGGQLLDRHTQSQMSARFGHDFSQVRIHTDAQAVQSAASLGANAYALGSDVVFGKGQWTPGSRETGRLLAHELTHVVQQGRFDVGDWGRASHRGDASEREADRLAARVMQGQSVDVQASPGAAVARDQATATCEPGDTEDGNPLGGLTDTLPYQVVTNNSLSGTQGIANQAVGDEVAARTLTAKDAKGALTTAMEDNLMPSEYLRLRQNATRSLADAHDPALLGAAGKLGKAGTALGVLGLPSGAYSTYQDIKGGHPIDAAMDGAGTASSGITVLQALGAVGTTGAAATAGSLLGSASGGYAAGTLLNDQTEVGDDTQDALGGIDRLLGGTEAHSSLVGLDDYRKEQWDRGGVGGVTKSIGAGVGEGLLNVAGAIGGLATGAWHGLGALAEGASAVQG